MDTPSAVDALLGRARERLDRVLPRDLADELAAGAVVVDIRPVEQRDRDGALPGAFVIDRNALEWRLDPTCPHRVMDLPADARVIIVCNEGYQSSLAAATLQELGLRERHRPGRRLPGVAGRHRDHGLAGGSQAPGACDPPGSGGQPWSAASWAALSAC